MFEEQNREQAVEETLENSVNQDIEKVSTKDVPSATAENVAETLDYLDPKLFKDIKILNDNDSTFYCNDYIILLFYPWEVNPKYTLIHGLYTPIYPNIP